MRNIIGSIIWMPIFFLFHRFFLSVADDWNWEKFCKLHELVEWWLNFAFRLGFALQRNDRLIVEKIIRDLLENGVISSFCAMDVTWRLIEWEYCVVDFEDPIRYRLGTVHGPSSNHSPTCIARKTLVGLHSSHFTCLMFEVQPMHVQNALTHPNIH